MDKGYVEHIYTGKLLSYVKNEIMPFAVTWLALEMVVVSEASQRKTDVV